MIKSGKGGHSRILLSNLAISLIALGFIYRDDNNGISALRKVKELGYGG